MSGKLPPVTRDELATIYSAAILADDDVPVTSEKIQTLLNAAQVDVEPIWPSLYAKALQGQNIKQLIATICTKSHQAPTTGQATKASHDSKPADEKKQEEEEEDDDDSDDMGINLFD